VSPVYRLALPLATCALVLLVACDRMATVKRCRTLARSVNTKLAAIEKATERRTPETYAEASKLYAELARDLDAYLPEAAAHASRDASPDAAPGLPPDPDPRGFTNRVREYKALMQAGARHTSGLAAALGAGNDKSGSIEVNQLNELTKQVKAATKRLDATCEPD
jgi:hypothetical protein